jgi:hypothetical protein
MFAIPSDIPRIKNTRNRFLAEKAYPQTSLDGPNRLRRCIQYNVQSVNLLPFCILQVLYAII